MQGRIIELFEHMPLERTFIIDNISGREISYAHFFSSALKVAEMIDNTVSSDTVVAVKDNSLDLAVLYFAVFFTEKKISVIDPKKGDSEISELLNEIGRTWVFADSLRITHELSDHFSLDIPEIDTIDVDSYDYTLIHRLIEKLKKRDIKAPYLITYTSGTSGVTKGVEHSLENLFLTAFALDDKVKKRRGCFLHVMPMTYMAGILNSLIYPFVTESQIVLAERFSII